MTRARLAKGSSKAGKAAAGRPTLRQTPLTIRSEQPLGRALEERIAKQLPRRLGPAAGVLERVTVRFEDINGPKGGVDTVCRIKGVLSGRPSIVVAKTAHTEGLAFSEAVKAFGMALRREHGKHGLRAAPRRGPSGSRPTRARKADRGELVGRRVGRDLSRALQRPEKRDRAYYVDTAAEGTSASDRRAGGQYTARRNTLARTTRATAMLEDSRTRPSRKSSRRSANRGKPSQTKERAAAAKVHVPRARALRGA
jgi:hypothetical protein